MKTPVPLRILLLAVLLAAIAGPVSATTFVQIYVHPGSGTVCLDTDCRVNVGTLQGTGSTSFRDPACGTDHTLRVYDTAGYEDYTDTVYVDYHCDSVTRTISLSPVPTETATAGPPTGTLQVYISPGPASAEVCLDSQTCEVNDGPAVDTWSVQFADVSADSPHTLSVDANGANNGYQPAVQQVSVAPDQVTTATINLVPLATVATTPPAAATTTPLGGEAVVLALGAAGALAVLRHRGKDGGQ